jgi:IclR family transcriptional regulator, blcABC operon repressor
MKTPPGIASTDDRSYPGSRSPAVARAFFILEALAKNASEPLGPTELARRLGIPKSTVANICLELEQAGTVRRVASSYVLGRRLVELGAAYLDGVDQVQEFHSACRRHFENGFETIQLATLTEDSDVLYVARHDGADPVRLYSEIGHRLPATCTAVGKAILASIPVDRATAILNARAIRSMTPNSITSLTELLEDLDRTRLRGYAIDAEESTVGIVCVGVVVPAEARARDRFAISATMLRARAEPAHLDMLASRLNMIGTEVASSTLAPRRLPA